MTVADRSNASLTVDRNIEVGRGAKTAYMTPRESLTYEELRCQMNRMGHVLRDVGVRREQRVLLVLDDTTVFPIAFLGALRIGAVPVPVSVRESADHFRHFVEDSYAEVVVCDADILSRLQATLTGLDVRFLARGAGEGAIDLDSALAAQDDELAAVATHPDDVAFWLYTSGSTGKPKGVVHLHHDIEVTCETFARQVLGLREDDRVFSTTKLYHSYGLGNSFSYPLHFGATAVLLDGTPTPERLLATLRQQRPTVYFSVPAVYRQLVADQAAGDAFESVRLCVSAAEPLPVRTFEQWQERFGLEILDGIGSTEMFTAYCSNRPGEIVPGTTGRPVPGYELRLSDEAGNVLDGPTVGTLEVRGDSCAAYYWHQHEQTRRSMRGGWFTTGDRFSRREDGTYLYVGRTDDMLKVGGLWVSPVDVERVLVEHPAVEQAGVVGVNIDDYNRVAAFVKCSAEVNADEQLEADLRSWCRDHLRDYEYPHVIRFVQELPQTLNGKPQRFKLREMIDGELAPPIDSSVPAATGSLAQKLAGLPAPGRAEAVMELVLAQVAEVLGEASVNGRDGGRAFEELGFDSLAAVELRNRLANASGLALASTLIYDHPTPQAVAALLRSRAEGVEAGGEESDHTGAGVDEPAAGDGATGQSSYLAGALAAVSQRQRPPRMPSAPLDIRLKTSPWLRALLPTRLAVAKAQRSGRATWEWSKSEREAEIAAIEGIIAGTPRADELEELARLHFIETKIDNALFWARPWSAKIDATSAARLNAVLSEDRGVLLSSCHLGPFYRLQCARPFKARVTYTVPGPWFLEKPTPNYWGRRLARWRKGMKSRPVSASGSFRLVQALLERGEAVFLSFDMPGPRETRFLGKPVMLAEGSAQLAVRADALVLPLRARRAGRDAWVDVGAPLDPRELATAEELHRALAAAHERWIVENPEAMADPNGFGWEGAATAQAWKQP